MELKEELEKDYSVKVYPIKCDITSTEDINNAAELEVTNGGYSGSVNIPEEVTYMNRTRKVTGIGSDAFYGCTRLTSIMIPNSVINIGYGAFYG